MAKARNVTATAADLVRDFMRYSNIALGQPVVVTKNGRPRNVLLSVAEYRRLKKRDQQTFFADDTPAEFVPQIEALAHGKRN
jgi:hypothetical protein